MFKGLVTGQLETGSVFISSLGSELVHPGLILDALDNSVTFTSAPQISSDGVLLKNARAYLNVALRFIDGARVRFSHYPVLLKAGSRITLLPERKLDQAA